MGKLEACVYLSSGILSRLIVCVVGEITALVSVMLISNFPNQTFRTKPFNDRFVTISVVRDMFSLRFLMPALGREQPPAALSVSNQYFSNRMTVFNTERRLFCFWTVRLRTVDSGQWP